jgi:Sec-independent protein translocase protein TatA
MATVALRHEVDELREYMKELSYQAMRTEMSLNRLSEEMREFKDEMREFKDEMRGFKDEMRVFKDEMTEFKDEMSEFKDEMSEFKDEMSEFKDEMSEFKDETVRDRQRMNKQWGDLANRLGTLVEDIVAPSLPRVAADLLGCDAPELFAVRVVKRRGGETREYDAVVVCPDSVLVNETKSRLQDQHIDSLLEKLAELPRFCPEYAGRRAVGVLASLYPDAGVVNRATRGGVLVMGMGDEAMQVLNPEALQSKG